MPTATSVTKRVRGAVLATVRRGQRAVLWHEGRLGFGNHLYLWQSAWLARRAGRDVLVLADHRHDAWLERFPALRELVVDRDRVRLRDQRVLHDQQVFGLDFGREDLEDFVGSCLLPHLPVPGPTEEDPGSATLNVRRGDYYSEPRFRAWYGMDLLGYTTAALALAERTSGPVTHLHVVSDDMAWCREHLGHLADRGRRLSFAEAGRPVEHFEVLGRSRRLLLTNSTFSYWGAYVSTTRYADNHAQVVAPWFHRRDIDDGRAWQLDPRWTLVTDLPGGWDA